MSEDLSEYVLKNHAKATKMELGSWLFANPLPTICEPKWDGARVFLFKSGDKLVLVGRRGSVFTPKGNPVVFSKIPEFVHSPNRMILDGEYVSKDGLHLFDVLQVDDREVRQLPLSERKKILREILEGTGLETPATYARSIEDILKFKEREIASGAEGIVCKNPMSPYGETNSWLKLKRFDTIDCFIIDYEDTPDYRRSGVPRSWFIGLYDDSGQVVNIGKVGSFTEKVDPRKVVKGSVVEVRFQEVTRDGKLRAPFIIKVRHDKTSEECLLSQII
ncbi:MAG: RNA ligase family protein [Nitrososphaerales archaeon]|jgi:ATP-dependent DNA ligase